MKTRVLSLLTAMCLCAALSTPAFAAQDTTKNQVWVYDGQVLDYDTCYHNMDEDSSGKGWSWSAATQTMTLNGFEGNFNFHSPGDTLKATVYLTPDTTNTITEGITMWAGYDYDISTLAIRGTGSLEIWGSVDSTYLDIQDAAVTVGGTVPRLIMRSGSLTARGIEFDDLDTVSAEAYYGGSVKLDNQGFPAFWYVTEQTALSPYSKVRATDKDGTSLIFGIYQDIGGMSFQGYGYADGTPATTAVIGGGTATPTAFTDVAADAYYADAVAWAVKEGITSGTSATTFSPNQTCTRGQIITFLWRAAGAPNCGIDDNFSDVAADAYYAYAARWAKESGMASGDTFSPDAPCTREMAVEFMWRYSGSPSAPDAGFTDVTSGAVDWAVESGVTSGTSSTTFSPEQTCTRSQIVTFLYRGFAE